MPSKYHRAKQLKSANGKIRRLEDEITKLKNLIAYAEEEKIHASRPVLPVYISMKNNERIHYEGGEDKLKLDIMELMINEIKERPAIIKEKQLDGSTIFYIDILT